MDFLEKIKELSFKYKDVLDEKVFKYSFLSDEKIIKSNKLYKDTFNKIKIKNDDENIFISLSGGVDSMVLLSICVNSFKNVVCCHINYNNREESKREKDFLIEYCKIYGCQLEILEIKDFKRGHIPRKEYEETTTNMRYSFYESILKKYNGKMILLGQHEDDRIENGFSNACRGRLPINLGVMKLEGEINNVKIFRPFLGHFKKDIYKYSFDFSIPYFKDTTPDWSVRGKLRRKIFPECEKTYTSFSNNINRFFTNVEQMAELLKKVYLDKFIEENVNFDKYGTTILKLDKLIFEPFLIKYILKIHCEYHKIPYFSHKKINIFIQELEKYIKTKRNRISSGLFVVNEKTNSIYFN